MTTNAEARIKALEEELKQVKEKTSQYRIFKVLLGALVAFFTTIFAVEGANHPYANPSAFIVFIWFAAGCTLLVAYVWNRDVIAKQRDIEQRIEALKEMPEIAAKGAYERYLVGLQSKGLTTNSDPELHRLMIRVKEAESLASSREASELSGHEKYLCNVDAALGRHEGFDRVEGYLANQYMLDSRVRANTHDPYVWGGMANGLAGPAAGVATALQTARENAIAETVAANTRANALGNYQSGLASVGALRGSLPSRATLERTKREVTSHQIDWSDESGYFNRLRFEPSLETVRITEGGSLLVDILISCEDGPLLHGAPAAIDGAIKVIAIVDEKPFAEGIIIGHAVGETDISKVGLSAIARPRGNPVLIVPISASESFTESTRYEFSYEPIHIWAIQQ